MKERWATVTGFPQYEVSDLGRVQKDGHVLKQYSQNSLGSRYVNLMSTKGNWTRALVARLVLKSFTKGTGRYIRYKDGDHTNCHLSNLCWSNDGADSGRASCSKARSTEIYLRFHRGESISDLSREFGIGVSGITGIVLKNRVSIAKTAIGKLVVRKVGEACYQAYFTEAEIAEIRSLYFDQGYTVIEISRLKNCDSTVVACILGGITYTITPDTPIRFLKSVKSDIPLSNLLSLDKINRMRTAYRNGVCITTIMRREKVTNYSVMQRALFTTEVPFADGESVRTLIETHNIQLPCNRTPFTEEELVLLREDIRSNKYTLDELVKKWDITEYTSRGV